MHIRRAVLPLRAALLAIFLVVASVASAGLADNPVLQAAQTVGARGLATTPVPPASPGKFKPEAQSSTLGPLLKDLVDEDELRKLLQEMSGEMITQFGKQYEAAGYGNDAVAALAYSVAILASVATEKEIDEAGIKDLVERFQATLNVPAVADATDRQKQEAYELSIIATTLTLVSAQSGEKQARLTASQMLASLIGVSAKQIRVEGGKVRITPSPKPKMETGETAPAAAQGLAPGFTYGMPQGWAKRGNWIAKDLNDPLWDGHVNSHTMLVQFLPARPAQGNVGQAIAEIWDSFLPAEAKGKQTGVVFRRFVGDGLIGQFIFGRVREKERDTDTLYTLMMVDCKTHWQPVLFAQIYTDNTAIRSTAQFMTSTSFQKSIVFFEEMVATFRCPPAKGQPLVTREALAGNYTYGSTSTLWTEHRITGSVDMNYTASSGTFNLKPDGTFTWTMGGQSRQYGGVSTFMIRAAGKWSIQGDILYVQYSMYDQGDSFTKKDNRYKIAGLTSFSDGVKVAVLLDDWEYAVNPLTVNAKDDWYSTKK